MTDQHQKHTPETWLKDPEFEGIIILDPDGWDRKNFTVSWTEPITRDEFRRRMMISTCLFNTK
jgi:hypothetical protein